MAYAKTVERYIEKHPHWEEQIAQLRAIITTTNLKEEIKWGAPAYTFNGKILLGIGAFKNHLGLWFHQGVFLKDTHKKLINAQETTKALRQWRFEKEDRIDEELVLLYVQESIENCLAGKEVKPERKKGVIIPPELKVALTADAAFKKAFTALTEGKQREYAGYIAEAKREATKNSRLKKITPMIMAGTGLHDQYKNC